MVTKASKVTNESQYAFVCFDTFVPSWLETVLHRELHDARTAALGRDPAERAGVETRGRIAPVEVVQQVEGLDADFHRLPGADRQQPRDGEVDGPVSRTLDAAGLVVAERARRRERERGRVEITGQRLVAVRVVVDLVDPLAGDAGSGQILRRRDRQPVSR